MGDVCVVLYVMMVHYLVSVHEVDGHHLTHVSCSLTLQAGIGNHLVNIIHVIRLAILKPVNQADKCMTLGCDCRKVA